VVHVGKHLPFPRVVNTLNIDVRIFVYQLCLLPGPWIKFYQRDLVATEVGETIEVLIVECEENRNQGFLEGRCQDGLELVFVRVAEEEAGADSVCGYCGANPSLVIGYPSSDVARVF